MTYAKERKSSNDALRTLTLLRYKSPSGYFLLMLSPLSASSPHVLSLVVLVTLLKLPNNHFFLNLPYQLLLHQLSRNWAFLRWPARSSQSCRTCITSRRNLHLLLLFRSAYFFFQNCSSLLQLLLVIHFPNPLLPVRQVLSDLLRVVSYAFTLATKYFSRLSACHDHLLASWSSHRIIRFESGRDISNETDEGVA